MESNFYRVKLLNAILHFARNTRKPNLTKVLKLLYLLDFQHFKETGYPSINLVYYTWPHGPVPKDFYEEVKDGNVPEDFAGKCVIIPSDRWEQDFPGRSEYIFKSIKEPDMNVFSPHEIRIIKSLCEIYRDATATQMKEVTHLPKQPWDTTKNEKGLYQYIDYLLSIDDTSSLSVDEARDKLEEHFEILNNFGLNPTKVE